MRTILVCFHTKLLSFVQKAPRATDAPNHGALTRSRLLTHQECQRTIVARKKQTQKGEKLPLPKRPLRSLLAPATSAGSHYL